MSFDFGILLFSTLSLHCLGSGYCFNFDKSINCYFIMQNFKFLFSNNSHNLLLVSQVANLFYNFLMAVEEKLMDVDTTQFYDFGYFTMALTPSAYGLGRNLKSVSTKFCATIKLNANWRSFLKIQ